MAKKDRDPLSCECCQLCGRICDIEFQFESKGEFEFTRTLEITATSGVVPGGIRSMITSYRVSKASWDYSGKVVQPGAYRNSCKDGCTSTLGGFLSIFFPNDDLGIVTLTEWREGWEYVVVPGSNPVEYVQEPVDETPTITTDEFTPSQFFSANCPKLDPNARLAPGTAVGFDTLLSNFDEFWDASNPNYVETYSESGNDDVDCCEAQSPKNWEFGFTDSEGPFTSVSGNTTFVLDKVVEFNSTGEISDVRLINCEPLNDPTTTTPHHTTPHHTTSNSASGGGGFLF